MLPEGIRFKVCWAKSEGIDDCPTMLFLEELFQIDESAVYAVVDYMEKIQDGRYLTRPTAKKIPVNKSVNDLYELRVPAGSRGLIVRIAWIYTPNREIILLNGIVKKTPKASDQFLDRAIRLRNKVRNEEMEYEEINFEDIRRSND